MSLDYEVEYNNRARVPDHAEIFARWQRDAAAYRDRMKAEENAELGLAYGTSARQKVDLFFFPTPPAHAARALYPWRLLALARCRDPQPRLGRPECAPGVAVAVAGYDLCPDVTIGQIINQIRTACLFLWRRFGSG